MTTALQNRSSNIKYTIDLSNLRHHRHHSLIGSWCLSNNNTSQWSAAEIWPEEMSQRKWKGICIFDWLQIQTEAQLKACWLLYLPFNSLWMSANEAAGNRLHSQTMIKEMVKTHPAQAESLHSVITTNGACARRWNPLLDRKGRQKGKQVVEVRHSEKDCDGLLFSPSLCYSALFVT